MLDADCGEVPPPLDELVELLLLPIKDMIREHDRGRGKGSAERQRRQDRGSRVDGDPCGAASAAGAKVTDADQQPSSSR